MQQYNKSNLQLHVQPYDINARAFYFRSAKEYLEKAAKLRNTYGEPVEEFEMQFIDGEAIYRQLFNALGINQCSIGAYFTACEDWDDDQKTKVIIATREAGYSFDVETDAPDDLDIELYEIDSLTELAQQFVDEGLFGDIPANISNYLDYSAIAYDLGMDYSETIVNAQNYVYRVG
jgi:antirestriction protein